MGKKMAQMESELDKKDSTLLKPVWSRGRKLRLAYGAASGTFFLVLYLSTVFLGDPPLGAPESVKKYLSPIIHYGMIIAAVGVLLFVAREAAIFLHPKIELTSTSSSVKPGDKLTVSWIFHGQVTRFSRLQIDLERRGYRISRKEAAYAKYKMLHKQNIAEYINHDEMRLGKLTFQIPEDAPKTYQSSRAWVGWLLVIHGFTRLWPDYHQEFELRIERSNSINVDVR